MWSGGITSAVVRQSFLMLLARQRHDALREIELQSLERSRCSSLMSKQKGFPSLLFYLSPTYRNAARTRYPERVSRSRFAASSTIANTRTGFPKP